MAQLIDHLNRMFRSPAAPGRQRSGFYVVRKGDQEAVIAKVGKLWAVTIDGQVYRNSRLGDLQHQVADLGWSK